MAVRIKDVARKAGVSVTTVSRVLNNEKYVTDELKQKVLAAIEEPRLQSESYRQKSGAPENELNRGDCARSRNQLLLDHFEQRGGRGERERLQFACL